MLLPSGELMVGDVAIQGGTIVQVAPNLSDQINNAVSQEIIDAQGLTLLPGVIDPQVHFREPGLEHKEDLFTASCACAQGGAQVANWMSTTVAKAYGIHNKGAIAPGYDADLVLVDLENYAPVRRETLKTKCGWSPFEGWELACWPVVTIVGGQVVYDHGKLNTEVRGQALTFSKA